MEIYKCSVFQIKKGDFPLNHDCILKVHYKPSLSLLKSDYMTCRACDSGRIVSVLSNISIINQIECSSVDNFCE